MSLEVDFRQKTQKVCFSPMAKQLQLLHAVAGNKSPIFQWNLTVLSEKDFAKIHIVMSSGSSNPLPDSKVVATVIH